MLNSIENNKETCDNVSSINNNLVIVRSGGDIASGIIQRLFNIGFKVIILEISNPSSIRREVCFGEAVYRGEMTIENITSKLVKDVNEIEETFKEGKIPVLIDGTGENIGKLKPAVLIDAILAKRNLGTEIGMAPITIGVGPGFSAGKDVDAVIETKRGHTLGKVIYEGEAIRNTGIPGNIGGYTKERVIHSEFEGKIENISKIGDKIEKGQVIARIEGKEVRAKISGILRGIIREGYYVTEGFKIADIDPRENEYKNCFTISDKARSIGGGALEAILVLMNRKGIKITLGGK